MCFQRSIKKFDFFILTLTLFVGLLSVFIFIFLIRESWPFLMSHPAFWGRDWHPTEGQFGMAPLIIGSLLTAIFSTLLSLPIAYSFAQIMITIRSTLFREGLRVLLETLSGLPSIVIGLWGLTFLVPKIAQIQGAGVSLLAAILILILMVAPILSLSFFTIFDEKIKIYLSSGQALGLEAEAILRKIILPSSLRSLFSQSYLGLGRALGETMAVLLVCGNIVQLPHSFFDAIRTLNTNIALETPYAMGLHRSSLFFGGLLLLILASTLLLISIRLRKNETI